MLGQKKGFALMELAFWWKVEDNPVTKKRSKIISDDNTKYE